MIIIKLLIIFLLSFTDLQTRDSASTANSVNQNLIESLTTDPVLSSQKQEKTFSQSKTKIDNLEQTFLSPPNSARPGVMWMWMGCNLSKEGITRDLEALKSAGFGQTLMFSLADIITPWACNIQRSQTSDIVAWSEPWWKLVRHAAKESRRLGLEFGMANCPGYESSGGNWITPEHSMKQICFSDTLINGGHPFSGIISRSHVDLHASEEFLLNNPETGLNEKPIIKEKGTYYRDIALIAMPAEGAVDKKDVIDLSGKMAENGKIEFELPEGIWKVYRFGYTTMGTLIQPAQWEAKGFECDKMSLESVTFHMNHIIKEIKKHLGDLIGTGFTFVHFDSYEAGIPTWTAKMPDEFLKRRGYDLTPYLATFAKRIIGSKEESDKFQTDFNSTIFDLYEEIYYPTIQRMLHEAGLEFSCEPYGGPWNKENVIPKIDRVITEFTTSNATSYRYSFESFMKALLKNGKNIFGCEAFTGPLGVSQWSETPEWLKPMGDAIFCAGVNHLVLHQFPQQCWDDFYSPGVVMGRWGTHFNRTQTWWNPGKAMIKYWHRCQAILQWGSIANQPADFKVISQSERKAEIHAIHRSDGKNDAFFVANTSRVETKTTCAFAVMRKQPELWDPLTLTMFDLPQYEIKDSTTIIPIEFESAQSFLIVFRKDIKNLKNNAYGVLPVSAQPKHNFPVLIPGSEITGSWEVKFDPRWGGPIKPVHFESLTDWTTHSESGIKYFSGTATYYKTFNCSQYLLEKDLLLDLGIVHHIARVKLNRKDLGVVWCAPWHVKIPAKLIKTTGNILEIEITNVWANRLIGDEQEPEDCKWIKAPKDNAFYLKEFPDWFLKKQQRPSGKRYCFTTWNYFTKDSHLISSGLLGPVRLMIKD
jgi:hypothetical protein